eukprot:TRINITY_DN11296_c0_g2_i2.p4 TRINITY_DN11296_c0_g2~~TRINITY_DN11296_c0_g2_i2.p4  ORF type:complete len:142 (+),score=20.07 TRINITY_DN11296_c0_g2_i2:406-831(+)
MCCFATVSTRRLVARSAHCGAPELTGVTALDEPLMAELQRAVLRISAAILRPGGRAVAKCLRGPACDRLVVPLWAAAFEGVAVAKPQSSRATSAERFIVAEGFRGAAAVPSEVLCVGDLDAPCPPAAAAADGGVAAPPAPG